MNQSPTPATDARPPQGPRCFWPTVGGVGLFLALQFVYSLWELATRSDGMENKFSALARDKYLSFLISQNLLVLVAYMILCLAAVFLVLPMVTIWTRRAKSHKRRWILLRAFLLTVLIHVFFLLRLAKTRPYFLSDAKLGSWYYKLIDWPPASWQPTIHLLLFVVFPVAVLLWVMLWHFRAAHPKVRWIGATLTLAGLIAGTVSLWPTKVSAAPAKGQAKDQGRPWNVIIVASDSLRGDRLGCSGYRPARSDGPAAPGVSPVIDALAARSIRFERCYTPIASTFESSVSFMGSQFPHTHGICQMYPDQATVEAMERKLVPAASVMEKAGYDTAAIGDWCAGSYKVVSLGFKDIDVSSFDNFKIYMSQAVVMAHFVVPLYFDNALGYRLFPEIGSFASFVTPQVVTKRVEDRIERQAAAGTPFFWHVFYSCNHLPYCSSQPYNRMFADPHYKGSAESQVQFDVDKFIGGQDLEPIWRSMPASEITQIRALYDGCTRQFDDCIARILKSLDRNGLADRTILVITADHGDDLFDPGVTLGHGLSLNGSGQANQIPMIVYVPGQPPQVIAEPIRSIDLMPTLADLLEVEKPAVWEGKSVAPWIQRTAPPETLPSYSETSFPFIQFKVPGIERPKLPPMDELTEIDEEFNYQFVLKEKYLAPVVAAKQRCLTLKNWKLVCTPTAEGGRHFALYRLSTDESGAIDRAADHPEIVVPMKAALERWIDDHQQSTIGEIFPNGEPE
jgi:arylsulfatase A-like enzyme